MVPKIRPNIYHVISSERSDEILFNTGKGIMFKARGAFRHKICSGSDWGGVPAYHLSSQQKSWFKPSNGRHGGRS